MLVKADMHIHSVYSDGRASPLDIILYAANQELGIISITDHDTFSGSLIATRYTKARAYGVLVIPGIEVRTDLGDVLVYCENEVNLPRNLGLLIDKAHSENCIVVPAHPFDVMRLGIGEAIYRYGGWDAIEVWNASSTKGSNYKAIEAAKILGKPGIANSDAHVPEEIGMAYTIIDIENLTIDSVLEAIAKGRVKPVLGRRPFSVTFKRLSWSIERSLRRVSKEKGAF